MKIEWNSKSAQTNHKSQNIWQFYNTSIAKKKMNHSIQYHPLSENHTVWMHSVYIFPCFSNEKKKNTQKKLYAIVEFLLNKNKIILFETTTTTTTKDEERKKNTQQIREPNFVYILLYLIYSDSNC